MMCGSAVVHSQGYRIGGVGGDEDERAILCFDKSGGDCRVEEDKQSVPIIQRVD